jgi:hypothetical protein
MTFDVEADRLTGSMRCVRSRAEMASVRRMKVMLLLCVPALALLLGWLSRGAAHREPGSPSLLLGRRQCLEEGRIAPAIRGDG